MPWNVQTTAQLRSSHMLAKWFSMFSKPGFNTVWTMNFQMFKLNLEKAEEPEIKLSVSAESLKKQENSRKTSATAAKLLQSCPTLCDPMDGSPPGSSVPGILQARTLEWVAISFSNAWEWKVKVKSLSRVQLSSITDLLTMTKPLFYGSQHTVENSSRNWNIRPPYLPPEKSVCRSGSNS